MEFAPYAKVPGGRVRKDARQGTIDQDPEFFAFLESLTQPITKPTVETATDGEEKKDSVTITPLVQYIKEKKANKAKEAAASKAAKQAKAEKESKSEKVQAKKLLQRPDKDTQATEKDKKKADKASKEAVKAANKQAATVKQAAKAAPPKETPTAPAAERKRERGNVAAAAKILQRDLGLTPAAARRKAAKAASTDTESPKEEAEPKKEPKAKGKGRGTPQPSETTSHAPPEGGTPPTSTPPGKPSKPAKAKSPPGVTPTATQAFLKHANPSQGVTEPLLETAFAAFGKILKVEIDRKKGFGYIDFAEPDGLQKAIAASPVSVAESRVVVLERKQNPAAEKSRKPPANGRSKPGEIRGRGRGRREGSASTSAKGGNGQGDKAPEAK